MFQEGPGTLVGYYTQIQIDLPATPEFCKARKVSNTYQALVNKELDRLVDQGVLTPVQFGDWVAPIVPVFKSNKQSVRISKEKSIKLLKWINIQSLTLKIFLCH